MRKESQILQVLRAIRVGCGTVRECSQYTGLPIARCAAHIYTLAQQGRIEKTGKVKVTRTIETRVNNYIAK